MRTWKGNDNKSTQAEIKWKEREDGCLDRKSGHRGCLPGGSVFLQSGALKEEETDKIQLMSEKRKEKLSNATSGNTVAIKYP